MKKIVFLVSGNGGNLRFLDLYLKHSPKNNFCIEAVIADRDCPASKYAQDHAIKSYCISYDKNNIQELNGLLQALNADLVVTTIYKILDSNIVHKYQGKLINIHYSLLPAFKSVIGIMPIQNAIDAGCRLLGSSTHYLSEEVDSGKIISQCVSPYNEKMKFDDVVNIIFRSGCLNLLNTINLALNLEPKNISEEHSLIEINGTPVMFSPALSFDTKLFSEQFWNEV